MSKKIKIIITSGTIDCEKVDSKTKEYSYNRTYLPDMLRQARCKADISFKTIMLKDSDYMNDSDREKILNECLSGKEGRIVITHGTDTMIETAKVLEGGVKNKTIVMLGSMIPYCHENSDALFNLGSAVTAVQYLPKGVYITMHGKLFRWNKVKKNKKAGDLGEFEEA